MDTVKIALQWIRGFQWQDDVYDHYERLDRNGSVLAVVRRQLTGCFTGVIYLPVGSQNGHFTKSEYAKRFCDRILKRQGYRLLGPRDKKWLLMA